MKPIRKLVTLSGDTARRVEEYRVGEGIQTTSEAMCRLVAAGPGMADARDIAPWFATPAAPPAPQPPKPDGPTS